MQNLHITSEIEGGPSGADVGAFFDLDGTLISGFSVFAFLRDRALSGRFTLQDIADVAMSAISFQRGGLGFSGMMGAMARMLRGTLEKELEETGQRIFDEQIAALVYPEARALVQAHLRQGHTLVIVSAATRFQVDPVAYDLGVSSVLCTRLEVKGKRLTGRVLRPACFGDGKLQAARAFAKKRKIDLDKSYFYTDGAEDLPLLDAVGRPRPTNPEPHLEQVARGRGWPTRRFGYRAKPRLSNVLRTVAAVTALPSTALMGLPAALIQRRMRPLLNFMFGAWGELGASLAGLEVAVEGEKYLWEKRPAVFLVNRQSAIDAIIVCKLLRRDFSPVARREARDVPILGTLAALVDTVFIEKPDGPDDVAALQPAVRALRRGISLVAAPEGTRTPTPRLAPFREGAFRIALEAGVPVVPIVIRNSLDALPSNALFVRPATVEVVVLPPIETDDWDYVTLHKEIAAVRALYEKTLSD